MIGFYDQQACPPERKKWKCVLLYLLCSGLPLGLVKETIISDCLLTEGWEDHLSVVMFSQCLEVYTLLTLVLERR